MNKATSEINCFIFEYYTNDSMASSSIGKHIEWEPHITKFIKIYNSLYKIKNIIDIGANFGYHTLFFSKEVEQNVFAFEPQIQNFNLLENNVKNNDIKNIILYNLACGDVNCDIKMPIIENTVDTINMGDFTPNFSITQNYSITKSVLLDDFEFNSQIDVIKIDVQGWEKKVLSGAHNLLQKNKPVLLIEFEFFQLEKTNTTCKELIDYIRNNGYYIYYLEYSYPSDHVCVHNDNLNEFKNKFQQYIFPHTINNYINNNIYYNINEKIVLI
jgi:FkbM family methyltransferase